MKKISVIIPVYNAEKWLEKSVLSMANQTIVNDLEIIYVNDGSTDNTKSILEKASKKYNNIKLINKKNGGVSSARNIGIKKSTCDYISFVDVDDYLDNDYFESLIEYKQYDLVVTGFIAEYSNSKTVNKLQSSFEIDKNMDIVKEFVKNSKMDSNCWNKLYKKSVIGDLRFDEELKYSEDCLFVFEYALRCKNMIILPIAKYHYVINDESAMRKGFNENRLKSAYVAEKISNQIKKDYKELYNLAKSREIDTKCRVLADLYFFNEQKKYSVQKDALLKDIREYGFINKYKYSSRKHFCAYILIRISPRLYVFFKKKLRFEFVNITHK